MAKRVLEYIATGRRKRSVARVRLALGVGKLTVNGRDIDHYFEREATRRLVESPFIVSNTEKRYDVIARVHGGGKMGQAGALRHGISRALLQADNTLKKMLKESGCLTRDARMKERKKSGQPGARKRFQFSKR